MFLSVLLAVAFLTVAERKTLGYMQRRVGPNAVGYYGILMAIADAAKLLLKEIVVPTHADKLILFVSPMISLISALLCSIRSTAQLISYELVLTTIILLCILIGGCVAECARPPFDNVEAESELVSGHMTEYSSSIFVLFFLSEYASILFLSTLTAILFMGGGTGIILGLKANLFAFTYIW
ncbi:NADH dehydrogenase family protein, partial (mitochondrion) [Candida albicans]